MDPLDTLKFQLDALRPRRAWSDRYSTSETSKPRQRRRGLGRFVAGLLAAVTLLLGFALWPPQHGAMIVVMAPWVPEGDAQMRIQSAGGVVVGPEGGAVNLFTMPIGTIAIGARPEFRDDVWNNGGVVLNAEPLLWLQENVGLFSRDAREG